MGTRGVFKLTFRDTLIILTAPCSVLFITPWQVGWIKRKEHVSLGRRSRCWRKFQLKTVASRVISNVISNKRTSKLRFFFFKTPRRNTHLGWSSWKMLCRLHTMPRRSGNPRPHPRTPNTASWAACSGRTCSVQLRFRWNLPLRRHRPRLWSGSEAPACTAGASSAWCRPLECLRFGTSPRTLHQGSSDPRRRPLGC